MQPWCQCLRLGQAGQHFCTITSVFGSLSCENKSDSCAPAIEKQGGMHRTESSERKFTLICDVHVTSLFCRRLAANLCRLRCQHNWNCRTCECELSGGVCDNLNGVRCKVGMAEASPMLEQHFLPAARQQLKHSAGRSNPHHELHDMRAPAHTRMRADCMECFAGCS